MTLIKVYFRIPFTVYYIVKVRIFLKDYKARDLLALAHKYWDKSLVFDDVIDNKIKYREERYSWKVIC